MFGLMSKKQHLEIMDKVCESYNEKMSDAIINAYNNGVKYGRHSAVVSRLNPNEIREAIGLPRVPSEEVSDNDKKSE